MRALIIALFLAGCATAQVEQDDPATCKNITQEFVVGVPFSWDVHDEEVNTKMDNGCTFTTITHYVLEDDSAGAGAGGSAPDPLHCDVDGCGGPLDGRVTYSDPVETVNSASAH